MPRVIAIAVALMVVGCSKPVSQSSNFVPDVSIVPDVVVDKLELVSIDPGYDENGERRKSADMLYEYPILGRVEIAEPADRKKLVDALREAVRSSDGTAAGCFEPRHVLRATVGETHRDYVICFACLQFVVYENGKRADGASISDSNTQVTVFNEVLTSAGVPIAP